MYEISIIVPAYNEENTIKNVITRIKQIFFKYLDKKHIEIIIIDDGSTDQTSKIVKKMNVRVIRHKSKLGYGAALKTGLKNAKAEIIGILDADGTYPPAILYKLFKKIKTYDLIIGARSGNIPFFRTLGNGFLNIVVSMVLKKKVKDFNSGIRVFKKQKILSLGCEYWTNGFSFTTTMTILAKKNNLKILEIPFMPSKRKGTSKLSSIHVGLKILKMLILCLLNKKIY